MTPLPAPSSWPPTRSRPRFLGVLVCLALAWAGALVISVPLAHGLQFGGDEGIELNKAAFLLTHGHWPAEAWNDQPLTHTRLYAWLLAAHYSPLGPRLWSLLTSVLLLFSVAFYIRSLGASGTRSIPSEPDAGSASTLTLASVTALAGAGILAVCPNYSELAMSAMQEIPATAFGMLALAMVAARKPPDHWRLWVAASAAAVGIAIKLTAGLYALAALITIWWGASSPLRGGQSSPFASSAEEPSPAPNAAWEKFVRGVGFACAVAAICASLLIWLDGRGPVALLRSHLLSFSASPWTNVDSVPNRWLQVAREFPEYLVFLGAGVARMLWGARPGRTVDRRLLVLPLLAFIFNASIRPWWPYYSISLWVGLAPLAGSGVGWAWEVGRDRIARRSRTGLSGTAAAALVGLVLLAGISAGWNWTKHYSQWRGSPRVGDSQIIATLRPWMPPGTSKRIYAADPIYAFWQKIPTPPEFLVVTRKRFLSGDLTPDTALAKLRAADCDFLVFVQDRGPQVTEVWGEFIRERYVLAMVSDGRELYVHRRLDPKPFTTTLHW